MPQPGDQVGDFVAGELSAFARLGALGDLDLELVGADEICRGHAEPAGRDLFDAVVGAISVGP